MNESQLPHAVAGLLFLLFRKALLDSLPLLLGSMEHKGLDVAVWLDKFRQELIKEAKNSIQEGVSYEDEVRIVEGVARILDETFLEILEKHRNCK